MQMFQLLSQIARIDALGKTSVVSLGWLSRVIRSIIESVGSVGVGIILFSLILRAIVLPFDIYQRIAMSKQNAKMKENKDKMEKLQKQYANDKAAYNQKLMEMYKENGISMFSSCLPAILSIVIFIVAINAFNSYSSYADLNNYNALVESYRSTIIQNAPSLTEESLKIGDVADGAYTITADGSGQYYIVVNEDADSTSYVLYTVAKPDTLPENTTAIEYVANAEKTYYVIAEKYSQIRGVSSLANDADQCATLLKKEAQLNVKEKYENEISGKTKFLWVKNIWQTDASFKHPVLQYSDFKSSLSKLSDSAAAASPYDSDSYSIITEELSAYKSQANGYYILIALSIGTILLQQFISMKTQKEQQKYSSADGSGANNQKMMMIIMTVMFAIFAFMYSASFSIYMITSNIISLIMTVVINKIVSVSMRKAEEKALQQKYSNRYPGRYSGTDKKNKK